MAGPVTLGSLRQRDEVVHFRCIMCPWEPHPINARLLPFPDDFPCPKLANAFPCPECRQTNGDPGYFHMIHWVGERVHPPPYVFASEEEP